MIFLVRCKLLTLFVRIGLCGGNRWFVSSVNVFIYAFIHCYYVFWEVGDSSQLRSKPAVAKCRIGKISVSEKKKNSNQIRRTLILLLYKVLLSSPDISSFLAVLKPGGYLIIMTWNEEWCVVIMALDFEQLAWKLR